MRILFSMLLAVVFAFGVAARAEETKPLFTEGVREFQFGDLRVTALADRRQVHPAAANLDLFLFATPEEIRAVLPEGEIESSINVFLLRLDDKVILVDTGLGAARGGTMRANLAVTGVKPEDVTDILITHLHGDHCGGLAGDDGKPAFPNATVWVPEKEYAYWHSDAERDALPEAKRGAFAFARAQLAACGDKVRVSKAADDEDGVWSVLTDDVAVVAAELSGHTPGHAGYLYMLGAEDLDETVFFWGDIMHRVELQAARPDISVTYDVDPEAAQKTRLELMAEEDMAAVVIAGAHLPFPGIGRFEKDEDGDGFVYKPLAALE